MNWLRVILHINTHSPFLFLTPTNQITWRRWVASKENSMKRWIQRSGSRKKGEVKREKGKLNSNTSLFQYTKYILKESPGQVKKKKCFCYFGLIDRKSAELFFSYFHCKRKKTLLPLCPLKKKRRAFNMPLDLGMYRKVMTMMMWRFKQTFLPLFSHLFSRWTRKTEKSSNALAAVHSMKRYYKLYYTMDAFYWNIPKLVYTIYYHYDILNYKKKISLFPQLQLDNLYNRISFILVYTSIQC